MYVCYLIKYSGDKLPRFYIGSTSLDKIKNGYRGSVVSKKYGKIFKNELKTNPLLFEYEILSEHTTREEALEAELIQQKKNNVIKSKDFINESYASVNGMFGRDVSGEVNPMFGKKHSEKTKKILSEKRGNLLRYSLTDEHKLIIGKTHKGKFVSEETKSKISNKKNGTFTAIDESRNYFNIGKNDERYLNGELSGMTVGFVVVKDINGNKLLVGVNDERYLSGELVHINKGKVMSDETKVKISESSKGKIISEGCRKKISEAHKGKIKGPLSEEIKIKISEANKGRVMSEETKQKLIISKTGMKYIERICPYCKKVGRGGNMFRYHFDNCKLR